MPRKYDSSRRTEAAHRTREAILEAAFRLHGRGIFDFDSLAIEANVSLPTVRKHFPTRELLFEGCTDFGMHVVTMPNIQVIATTADATVRLTLAVRQVYGLHEQLLGQMWSAFSMEDESPSLKASTEQVAELVSLVADLILEAWHIDSGRVVEIRGLIIGLLHPLSYRALRNFGGLSPEQAIDQTTAMLLKTLQPLSPVLQETAHR